MVKILTRKCSLVCILPDSRFSKSNRKMPK